MSDTLVGTPDPEPERWPGSSETWARGLAEAFGARWAEAAPTLAGAWSSPGANVTIRYDHEIQGSWFPWPGRTA